MLKFLTYLTSLVYAMLLAFILMTAGCKKETPETAKAPAGEPGPKYGDTPDPVQDSIAPGLRAYHDDKRKVTCYTALGGGLSCVPDAAMAPPAAPGCPACTAGDCKDVDCDCDPCTVEECREALKPEAGH